MKQYAASYSSEKPDSDPYRSEKPDSDQNGLDPQHCQLDYAVEKNP